MVSRVVPLLLAVLVAGCSMPGLSEDPPATGVERLEDLLPTARELPPGYALAEVADLDERLGLTANPLPLGARLAPWNPQVGWAEATSEEEGDAEEWLAMSAPEDALAAAYQDDAGWVILVEAVRVADDALPAAQRLDLWSMWYHPCDETSQGVAGPPVLTESPWGAAYGLVPPPSDELPDFSEEAVEQAAEDWAEAQEPLRAMVDAIARRTGAEDLCEATAEAEDAAGAIEEPNDTRADAWSEDGTVPAFSGDAYAIGSEDDVDWFEFVPQERYFSFSAYSDWGDLSVRIEDDDRNVIADLEGDELGCDVRVAAEAYYVRVAAVEPPPGRGKYALFLRDLEPDYADGGYSSLYEETTYPRERCPGASP